MIEGKARRKKTLWSGRLMRIVGTSTMVLLLATSLACRSTPPPQEEPAPVEEPEVSEEPDEAEPEEPQETDSSEDDDAEVEEGDDEGETVASHVDARIQSALSEADDGDVDAAIDSLTALVDEPDGGFLASYNLGVLHDRRGDQDEAAEFYAQALQRQPDFTPALLNLIRLYLRDGEVSKAQEIGRHIMDERPDNLDHRAAYLEIPLAQERYEDVAAGAREILRRDIEHVDAMIQLATAQYHLERYELARAVLLGRAVELSPDRAEIYFLLGHIALEFGEREVAQRQYERAINLQPRFPEARNSYAILLHEAGNYERAIEQLEAALQDAPLYVEATINLANAYKAQGDHGDAEETYLKALELDDQDADAHFNLGILYLEAEVPDIDEIPRLEKAIESFNAYRQIVGEREASENSIGNYIQEAVANIESEEERQEALRRAQSREEEQEQEQQEDDDSEENEESDDDGVE